MRHFGLNFKDKHKDEIQEFLIKAKQYGYGKATPIIKQDGANEITYKLDDWLYTDTWYGGEPFSGITTIAYRGKVCWVMHYHGEIGAESGFASGYRKRKLTECLMGALSASFHQWGDYETIPVRGPRDFSTANGYIYNAEFIYGRQDISSFCGTETIKEPYGDHDIVYDAEFFGGFVNLY